MKTIQVQEQLQKRREFWRETEGIRTGDEGGKLGNFEKDAGVLGIKICEEGTEEMRKPLP